MQVDRLSSDYYAIFKRITKYDYWDLTDLYRLNNLNPKKRKDKVKMNSKLRILSQSDYKKIVCTLSVIKTTKGFPKVHQLVHV